MPKSKKKPRPAWDTLFGALKENGNVRDMTKIYLEIQSQALNLHYYETRPVYFYLFGGNGTGIVYNFEGFWEK